MSTLTIGDKAPQFGLPDENGNPVTLSSMKGKWVILYFYPRDNTPGCTTEAIDFSAGIDEFSNMNARVLGVSRDSQASHRRFIDKKALKVTLLTDAEHKMMEDYGVWQLKKMYGKESMGIVRSTFIIDPDGKIARIWSKVKVKGHVDEVKNSLKEISS
ncbi:MAG: thioredoxin-dependent thiol peroxidase [Deltaproteobacteria bacterium]|nr:thioredoxin-dependent thiol peroxidase [Deltaproteobacteria bacterium]